MDRYRTVGAVIAAAGSSSRMGGRDKLAEPLDGIPVILRTLAAVEAVPEIREIVDKVQAYVSRQDKELQVKAGVGKVVEGVINLPDSFKEANEAFTFVDIAGEISEDGNSQVTLFSDLGIFKLLCQLDNPELLLEYVPEGLQKLYNYKKPQRDDLLITLKTYLDRNLNLSKTAQDLFVHYKTASYRIEKIAKITGVDFDNANEVLAFRIGLVVYKMIEKYNKDYL